MHIIMFINKTILLHVYKTRKSDKHSLLTKINDLKFFKKEKKKKEISKSSF